MNYEGLEDEFQQYSELVRLIESLDMVTPVDIQTGITALTRTTDLVKKARELAEKTQNVEIKEITVELRERLVDTKSLLVDTKEEVVSLKQENERLKKENETLKRIETGEITQKEGYIYVKDKPGVKHCIKCWSEKTQLIEVAETTGHEASLYKYKCNACRGYF